MSESQSTLLAFLGGPADWILLVGAVAIFAIIAQRDWQRYQLQKAAIEKGMTILPTGTPIWVASLKKGMLVLALGVGLIVMGAIGLATLPNPDTMQNRDQRTPPGTQPGAPAKPATTQGVRGPQLDGMMLVAQVDGPPEGEDPRPPRGSNGEMGPPRMGRGPGGRPMPPMGGGRDPGRMDPQGDPNGAARPDGPPSVDGRGPDGQRGDPRMERRRQAEESRMLCRWAIGAGGVLSVVGLVLTLFALVERKHVVQASAPTSTTPPQA